MFVSGPNVLTFVHNIQVEATAAKPFNIHESEPNLDRVHHDMMKDDNLLPENRWPCVLYYIIDSSRLQCTVQCITR